MNEKPYEVESFAKRIKRESNGYVKLSPEFVARIKHEQTGHIIALMKHLGRDLHENEIRELEAAM